MAVLKKAVEKRKKFLINRLIVMGTHKVAERQLYELTLSELEQLYISVACRRGKDLSTERSSHE